jgi:hypothetical protein
MAAACLTIAADAAGGQKVHDHAIPQSADGQRRTGPGRHRLAGS